MRDPTLTLEFAFTSDVEAGLSALEAYQKSQQSEAHTNQDPKPSISVLHSPCNVCKLHDGKTLTPSL